MAASTTGGPGGGAAGHGATPPRRSHPATVAVKAVRAVPVLALAYLLVAERPAPTSLGGLLLGLVAMGALASAAAAIGWLRTVYYFDDAGDFRIDSGLLYRKERRLALSRLQSVDIVRPLLARLVGMSSVRIEVAGSSQSRAVVEYLPSDAAESLRAQVLARAGGAGTEQLPVSEEVVLRVRTEDLVVSLLLRGTTVVAVVLTVLSVFGVLALTGPAGLLAVGFGIFAPVVAMIGEFASFHGFTVARSDEGLRLRAGLLGTTAQTVPPGRVHAVEFSQPFLWRSRGWVRVTLNVAGGGVDSGGGSRSTPRVLLPVAPREQALALVAELLPEWDVAAVALQPAPPAARMRAPLQHADLAHGSDQQVFVTRRGRFVRRTAVVAHARVQSVRLVQGPWQRRLGLATVRADTVPGPVAVAALHLDAESARRTADAQVALVRAAIARGEQYRWRVAADGAASGGATADRAGGREVPGTGDPASQSAANRPAGDTGGSR